MNFKQLLEKKSKIVFIFLAILLVIIASYVMGNFTNQPNNNDVDFLKNTKKVLDDYLIDIPKRKDNQIFEQDMQTLHTEIDEKVKQSNFVYNTQIQQTIKESNYMFSKMNSPDNFIHYIDAQWESSNPDIPGSVSYNLINNPAADVLRDVVDSDQKSENKFKYVEIFVTNSYGVNIAQTGKTSDYLQADETWWQEAKQNGLFVSERYFDDSAGVYATEIAMSITDEDGEFIGVLKIVLNIESIDQNKMIIDSWLYSIFR